MTPSYTKEELREALDPTLKEAARLLDWAAKEFEKHKISADNWYGDYLYWIEDYSDKIKAARERLEQMEGKDAADL